MLSSLRHSCFFCFFLLFLLSFFSSGLIYIISFQLYIHQLELIILTIKCYLFSILYSNTVKMLFICKSRRLPNVYHLGGHDNTSYGIPHYIYPLLLYLYPASLLAIETRHYIRSHFGPTGSS
jgi:hypothetical protein